MAQEDTVTQEALQARIRELEQRLADSEAAQQALAQREEHYRQMVENVNDILFRLDPEGRVTYISPAVALQSGYTVDELVGQPFVDFGYEEVTTQGYPQKDGRVPGNDSQFVILGQSRSHRQTENE